MPRSLNLLAFLLCGVFGYSVCSYVIFALGLLSLITPVMVVAAAVIGLVVAAGLYRPLAAARPSQLAGGDGWLLGTGLLAALPLVHVLRLPPYVRDDLIYHLEVPKRLLQSGRLWSDAFNINSNMPMLFELPLTLAECSGGWLPPQVVNWFCAWALVVACGAFALEHAPPRRQTRAVLTAAVVAALYTPVIYDLMRTAYVELFFALLVVLGLTHALRTVRESAAAEPLPSKSTGHDWYLAMLLLGLACAVKYLGWIYLGSCLGYAFFQPGNRRRLYTGAGLAVLVASPWYLKNWLLRANPVYPLLASVFASPELSVQRVLNWHHLLASYTWGDTLRDDLLLPVRLLAGLDREPGLGRAGFDGRLSGFFGLALVGWSWQRLRLRWLSCLCLVVSVGWAVGSQQVRFLLPVALLMAFAGLRRLAALPLRQSSLNLLIGLCLALVLAQSGSDIAATMRRDHIYDLLTGRLDRDGFLAANLPNLYALSRAANARLDPHSDRLLTIGIFGRNYYFDAPATTVTYYDSEFLDAAFTKDAVDPAVATAFLQRLGITHIVLERGYLQRFNADNPSVDSAAMNRYLDLNLEPLAEAGPLVLLRVTAPP